MILLENGVPQVYVDESRDFQFFLRAYNVIFNMVKQDINTLQYITNTEECETRILPLLKTKLGFFTNYDIDDTMLRWILRGFPYMVKNKGSLESIRQAVYTFLKALNIKTKIVIKVVGDEGEQIEGNINVGDHTILIAIESAVQNFYVLDELFKYIMPIGYQYNFYFYKTLEKETWLVNKSTGKFLIVNTSISDAIRTDTFYEQDFYHEYSDPEINKLMNQVNLININNEHTETSEFVMKPITGTKPAWFDDYYYYIYRVVDGKYFQLKLGESVEYVDGQFFIPQFFFINEEDIYEKLTDNPTFEYKDGTQSLLVWEYFNYYEKGNDGRFRNLQEPVINPQDNYSNYYKIKDEFNKNAFHVKAIASNVESFAAIPITTEYFVVSTSVAQ